MNVKKSENYIKVSTKVDFNYNVIYQIQGVNLMNFYKRIIFVFSCSVALVFAKDVTPQQIGSMLMVGFYGTSVSSESQICKDISKYNLAGVILFDYNPVDRNTPKNIASKDQLAKLTKELQNCSKDKTLLIAVDQEGGKVQRLKSSYGFLGNFPSAQDVAKMDDAQTMQTYTMMAKELKSVGINYDLAPVVDLALNSSNYVIYQLKRSFGDNPQAVAKKADLFMDAMHKEGILTSLKHFPGHGSSLGDTHKGYVDVSNVWSKIELEPYKILGNKADSVMVAHVFNAKIDESHPASLSRKTINGILRGELGYDGVVITDDLQMGAIAKSYELNDILRLGINAGNDILLFGNQLDPNRTISVELLVNSIKDMVSSGQIAPATIHQASKRVELLKQKL